MRRIYRKIFILVVVLVFPIVVFAQNPTKWTLESESKGKTLTAGENFKAKLKAEIEGDWHLYAMDQPKGGPVATTIKTDEPFKINGEIKSPPPITEFDPNFKIDTKFYKKAAEFDVPQQTTVEASANNLALNVRCQLCNDTLCLPPKTLKVSFAGTEAAGSKQLAAGSNENLTNENSASNNQQLT